VLDICIIKCKYFILAQYTYIYQKCQLGKALWLSISTCRYCPWQFSMLYRMCTDPSSRHFNSSSVTVYAMYISRVLLLSHLLSHMKLLWVILYMNG